ncbi:ABC transporter ATP-binding protein [Bacillus sp. DJP31]|uniref:ABC transporter ATP-binding protein n=1 Tax=Bacillus sp. DJP31 TaxID=3409789 RepID=UPI003BB64044
MSILTVKNITKRFDGLVANEDVSFEVKKGSITAVIGPNGAGKTTLFNMVTGVYKPTSGSIMLEGESISGKKPHLISRKGVARTFQNIRLFGSITVLENVMVGMHNHLKGSILGTVLRLPSFVKEEEQAKHEAYRILEYVGLEHLLNEAAQNLSYGAQRRLEIARALATKPKVLLLDEPAAGMNPKETRELTQLIHTIREELDVTIILIEHDMKLVMEISEHIVVLDHGVKIAEGNAEDIRKNPEVIKAYLGSSSESSAL